MDRSVDRSIDRYTYMYVYMCLVLHLHVYSYGQVYLYLYFVGAEDQSKSGHSRTSQTQARRHSTEKKEYSNKHGIQMFPYQHLIYFCENFKSIIRDI